MELLSLSTPGHIVGNIDKTNARGLIIVFLTITFLIFLFLITFPLILMRNKPASSYNDVRNVI